MWRSPLLWLGITVSLASLWWAFRDVDLREVALQVARAHWGLLLGISLPTQVAAVHLRALRWRHLTDPIAPIGTGPLFRATAVGFMANNLFPLRLGEILRAWYLARETGTDAPAILATVLLERVIDTVTFLLMAALLFSAMGARGGPSTEMLVLGLPALLLAAVLPLAAMVALRIAPDRAVAVAGWFGRFVLPAGAVERLQALLRRFSEGLGSIKGGVHLFWIALHSILIWFVFSMLPFAAAIWAMDIDLGSLERTLEASYATLVAVGLAVSLPSAPGFFGLYHTACRIALGLFGVPWDQAVALGTVAHLTFWVSMIALGLVCLRFGRTSFEAVTEAASEGGQVESEDRR
ncbi:MAG TPA: lysylphosphatidylglycerol synthase transmembrane domain-containing protein [Myxococcota bacterium]|jgi:uncharacterized protein (TIRG00374 family)|nr:lysylphosphatidylglycerol synthase transmembrane domain-containing protein [Myxococcota bacterium]